MSAVPGLVRRVPSPLAEGRELKLGDLIVEKVDDRTSPLAEGRELKYQSS